MPVVRPEYLVAMKMVAHRDKDMLDLEFLTTIVDVKKVRPVLRKFLGLYSVDEFERVVEESAWKRSRGRV